MNDIFKDMTVPQLGDPNFQLQFNKFCGALIENIQRLISVQYTKGEPGNSVVTNKYTVNYTVNQDQWKLSSMGRAISEKIFGQNSQEPVVWNWDGANDKKVLDETLSTPINTATIEVGGIAFVEEGLAPKIITKDKDGNIKEYNAIPDLLGKDNEDPAGIDIEINVDPVKGEAFLASPYLFIDGRIEGLNKVFREHHDEDYYKTFHDFSTAVYGKATYDHNDTNQDKDNPLTWNWEFELVNIVPKLYFDQNINEFCWEVNGQKTGITAQGIKGDDGITPNVLICIGNKVDAKLFINKVLYSDENGNGYWALKNGQYDEDNPNSYPFIPNDATTDPSDIPQPKDNDIALVFFDDPDVGTGGTGDPYHDAYMGRVFVGAEGAYVIIGYDEDDRVCDVFKAIRQHNFWGLMLDINNPNVVGSPRGVVIPAEPTQEYASSDLVDKTHLIYAERNGVQDSNGYAKLHMAPVSKANTHADQHSNPSDHIGDMQVDYNMDVKGNMQVQGALGVQGPTNVQNINVQGNANVQGDMTVQGTINAHNFTVSGLDWPTMINSPKLACMSRFKDVYYVVNRKLGLTPTGVDNEYTWDIIYNLVITGVLELNIGMLSMCGDDTINDPHKALQGYADYWEGGETNDTAKREDFAGTGSRERSKMYNVVTYNIPFNLMKSVSQPTGIIQDGLNSGKFTNIWGFKTSNLDLTQNNKSVWGGAHNNHNDGATWRQEISSIDDINKISMRIGITGVNWSHKIFPGTGYETQGSYIGIANDDNGIFIQECQGISSQGESISIDYLNECMQSTPGTQGMVQGLIKINEPTHTVNADIAKYSVNGRLYYAPLNDNVEINYAFDFFSRIFEFNKSNWNKKSTTIDGHNGVQFTLDSIKYNTSVTITPVGCIQVRDTSSGVYYMAPIWPAVNIKNVGSSDIVLNQVEDVNSGGDITRRTVNGLIPAGGLFIPDTNLGDEPEFKSITGNPLISGLFSKKCGTGLTIAGLFPSGDVSSDDETVSVDINGPVGNIIVGKDIESNYIMGIFDRRLSDPNPNDAYMQGYDCGVLKTSFFDLTPNMRVVSENIKVCPNNTQDGSWTIVNGQNAVWESRYEVPVVILPREGTIEGLALNGGLKIGVGNYQTQGNAPAVSLKGVLMYPYTSCLVMVNKLPNGNIIYNCIADGADDSMANPDAPQSDMAHAGHHYISSGRMMGVTNGEVGGMATRVNDQGSIVVPDITPDEDIQDRTLEMTPGAGTNVEQQTPDAEDLNQTLEP